MFEFLLGATLAGAFDGESRSVCSKNKKDFGSSSPAKILSEEERNEKAYQRAIEWRMKCRRLSKSKTHDAYNQETKMRKVYTLAQKLVDYIEKEKKHIDPIFIKNVADFAGRILYATIEDIGMLKSTESFGCWRLATKAERTAAGITHYGEVIFVHKNATLHGDYGSLSYDVICPTHVDVEWINQGHCNVYKIKE